MTFTLTYRLQIADDANFRYIVFERSGIETLSYRTPFLFNTERVLYARVREEILRPDGSIIMLSEWSTINRFETQKTVVHIQDTSEYAHIYEPNNTERGFMQKGFKQKAVKLSTLLRNLLR